MDPLIFPVTFVATVIFDYLQRNIDFSKSLKKMKIDSKNQEVKEYEVTLLSSGREAMFGLSWIFKRPGVAENWDFTVHPLAQGVVVQNPFVPLEVPVCMLSGTLI